MPGEQVSLKGRKLVILSPVGFLGQGPRLSKLAAIFLDLGLEVEHWGWKRVDSEADSYLGIPTVALLEGGGYSGGRKLFPYYLKWVKNLIKHLKAHGQGRDFYCVGFLSGFAVCLTRRRLGSKYLYDNNDNFSLSYPWPGSIKSTLTRLDKYVAKHAKLHVVPSRYRWPTDDANLRILANTPSSSAVKAAKAIVQSKGIQRGDKLRIYVNGLLDRGRGPAQLLAALKKVQSTNIELLIAGRLVTEEAEQLSKLPYAKYLGILKNEEALAEYWGAHVLFTFYDPAVPINRLAEPNKWGDCIIANTPFIVNSEVETAKPYIDAGACFHVPYEDADALAALIDRLAKDPTELKQARENLAKFSAPPWDEGMRAILCEYFA